VSLRFVNFIAGNRDLFFLNVMIELKDGGFALDRCSRLTEVAELSQTSLPTRTSAKIWRSEQGVSGQGMTTRIMKISIQRHSRFGWMFHGS
jgi:hypothetical protein